MKLLTIALLALTPIGEALAEIDDPVRHPAIRRASITVTDLERSLTLYEDVLGLQVDRVVEYPADRFIDVTNSDGDARNLREAILTAGSTPNQEISLLETGTEMTTRTSSPVLWLEVYNYASVLRGAEALGLGVSPGRSLENLEHQPIRERSITDWDGNVVIVYRLQSAELMGGECVAYGETQRWEVFDDRQVYVQGTEDGTSYLITTRNRCRNVLRDARRIEVAKSDGFLCIDGARLSFRTGSLVYNCAIERIEGVSSCNEAHRLATERRPDWRPFRNTPHYVCVWERTDEESADSPVESADQTPDTGD